VLSIVGIDRVGLGYYRAKQRQEALAMAGPVPASVLRATQFHEFTLQVSERGGRFGGALLPKGPGPRGQQTFDEWFAAR